MNNKRLPVTRSKVGDGLDEFCLSLIVRLEGFFSEGTQIERLPLQKNNGVLQDSICIREPGVSYSPAIHIDPYYKQFLNGADFEAIVEAIIEDYEEYKKDETFDISDFGNYEWIKEHLGFKLVNYKENEKMLKDIPHVPFLDLAIVVFVDVTDIMGVPSTFTVRNGYLRVWNVETGRLIKEAMENAVRKSPAMLRTMTEILDELSDERHMEDEELPMYVLTNASKNMGAGCILYRGILQACAERIGNTFYLLPSSIHEWILIPCDKVSNPEELICIVRDVNSLQVLPSERLSDYIYKYDGEAKTLSRLGIENEYTEHEEVTTCSKISLMTQMDGVLS